MPPKKEASKKPVSKKPASKKAVSKKASKTKIYCGAAPKLPKNSKFGSMVECVQKNQVRRFGLLKVDSKLIDTVETLKKSKKNLKSVSQLEAELMKINKTITKLNIDIPKCPKTTKEEIEKKQKMIDTYKKLHADSAAMKKLLQTMGSKRL